MEREVIGIFHNPWQSRYEPRRSLAQLYRRAVWLKANPRSVAYMEELFLERYPQGRFINVDEQSGWRESVAAADAVVMLYPDSIGLGFSRIEAAVKRQKKRWAVVRALNGRRREFILKRRTVRQLKLRRFLERSMLGEAAAVVAFVAVTPLFVVSDLVRGRR
ncbi:MAG TPA: hypothetical protein VKA70_08185 [Blastocatellia bacterium]|nr:hypothetical protein [Blastocatellia bacterium]